jgi:hypothetical protein
MNALLTRGLALAAITAGLTFFGTSAANAITIGGDGGILGDNSGSSSDSSSTGGILGTGISLGSGHGSASHPVSKLHAHAPVSVNNAHVHVLDGGALNADDVTGNHSVLGHGVQVTTGTTMAELVGAGGLTGNDVVDIENLMSAALGVPLGVSGTWASALGDPANGDPSGVVVVPNAAAEPNAAFAGVLDGIVDAPVNVQCTEVTVLSDFAGDCASGGAGGGSDTAGNGDVTLPVAVQGLTDLGLSVPVSIQCVGVGVLATADPGCGDGGATGDDGDNGGAGDNGDTGGTDSTGGTGGADGAGGARNGNGNGNGGGTGNGGGVQNPCVADSSAPLVTSATTVDTGLTLGVASAAGLAGALGAVSLIGIGRKFSNL